MNPVEGSSIPEDPERAAQMSRSAPLFTAGDTVPGLSSWLLERWLGGGGFGEVWLARHEFTDARRAVKFCTDPVARNRLVTHEKKVVARVMKHAGNHPNIVPLLEHNLDGAIPWLMYELVEGGTLAEAINRWKSLAVPERVKRAVQTLRTLTSALATFHQLDPPIVHRDLKPQNVLMAGETPRITDFGIGSAAVEAVIFESKTRDSIALPSFLQTSGSMKYASPEQAFGSAPGPRDDVYSLGVIAYQMLVADTRYAPGADASDELGELSIPIELIALIVQSTALDPVHRPQDAREWETALAAIIQKGGASTVTLPPSAAVAAPISPAFAATPTPSQVTKMRRVDVRGKWRSRPIDDPSASWQTVTATPADVACRPEEVYALDVSMIVTDTDLAKLSALADLDSLRALDLRGCERITDAGVARLTNFAHLQSLDLYGCKQLTDASLKHLGELSSLQWLYLGSCKQLTNAGLMHLAGLSKLRALDLSDCDTLTDAGLTHLKGISALRALDLSNCGKLTEVGVAALQKALPRCKIER